MAKPTTGTVGHLAENEACKYLCADGFRILERNFRRRGGEIDIIAIDDACLVFVEVRYRSSARFAPARLTVDFRKQQKLIRTAAIFVAKNPHYAAMTMRFDVVAIDADDDPPLRHIRDAFRPNHSTY